MWSDLDRFAILATQPDDSTSVLPFGDTDYFAAERPSERIGASHDTGFRRCLAGV